MRSFAFVDGVDEVTDAPQGRRLVPGGAPRPVPRRCGRATTATRTTARCSSGSGSATAPRSTRGLDADHHRRRALQRSSAARRALRAIHARARRVYLLDPEPPTEWDTANSIVSTSTGPISTASSRCATCASWPTRSTASPEPRAWRRGDSRALTKTVDARVYHAPGCSQSAPTFASRHTVRIAHDRVGSLRDR